MSRKTGSPNTCNSCCISSRRSGWSKKGSPASKEPDKTGLETDEEQLVREHSNEKSPAWARISGWRRTAFSNSLGTAMGLIFIFSWLVQSITGNSAYNERQLKNFQ